MTKKQSKSKFNKTRKVCKGSIFNYKNIIANRTVYYFSCKNNHGKYRECAVRIKEYLDKNNVIEEVCYQRENTAK